MKNAQWQLGDDYKRGRLGLYIDLQLALMWYRKVAKGGDDSA